MQNMQKYAWHLFHYLKLVHLMKFKKLIIISNVQVKKIIEVCVAYHTWSDQLWITRHHIDKNIFLELDQSLTHIKVTDTWNASILWKLFLLLQLVARLNCSVTQTQKRISPSNGLASCVTIYANMEWITQMPYVLLTHVVIGKDILESWFHFLPFFEKSANPGLFFVYFRSFQTQFS